MTYNIGDPNHLGVHNELHAEVASMAEQGGIEVDLPPQRNLGDTGHTDDHNKIVAALEEIASTLGPPGRPPAPVITNPEGGPVINFTTGGEGDAGPTITYVAKLTPNMDDETVTVEVNEDMSGGAVVISEPTSFTDYVVSIQAVNVAGGSDPAETQPFQLNYNRATGGTITYADNYNGTGERWKLHTFDTPGTDIFFVQENPRPNQWRLLVIGGAGSAGSDAGSWPTGGGGAGGCVFHDTIDFPVNPYSVTVGGGGGSVSGVSAGHTGGESFITYETVDVRAKGGGGGGSSTHSGKSGGSGGGAGGSGVANNIGRGTAGQGHDGKSSGGGGGGAGAAATSATGGAGRVINITGSDQTYCKGGNGSGGNGSTGGGTHIAPGGRAGKNGCVIVAYAVGGSTRAAIAAQEAARAAREDGYDSGYDSGYDAGTHDTTEALIETYHEAYLASRSEKPTEEASDE